MDNVIKICTAPCLVVHDSPFVARDIYEILMSCGAEEVELVHDASAIAIASSPVVIITNAAFAALPIESVSQWRAMGVPILVLDGVSDDDPGIRAVQQPFRSEHITGALRELNVF